MDQFQSVSRLKFQELLSESEREYTSCACARRCYRGNLFGHKTAIDIVSQEKRRVSSEISGKGETTADAWCTEERSGTTENGKKDSREIPLTR
jgi:hypothetical protein